jgi:CubicO group peptidase (beta-lactamase class C family)
MIRRLSSLALERLHDRMAGYVARGDVPGVVALLSRRGEMHVEALGVKTVGNADPVRRDSIFRIASMTKPITAAASRRCCSTVAATDRCTSSPRHRWRR